MENGQTPPNDDPASRDAARGEAGAGRNSVTLTGPGRLPRWKTILFSILPLLVFLSLVEVGLFIAGVKPVLLRDDPFVGFASNVPLFVERTDAQGRQFFETAANKLTFFNHQTFPKPKSPGTYRIFCLGGSTTYGRPYDDRVSFAGWLRELLPAADPSRRFEVINAGGISYASYRVAMLMQELARYEPDLFIIYSGHNEFLEQRSYGALKNAGHAVTGAASRLARTRTWAAASWLLERFDVLSEKQEVHRIVLPGEVDTILEKHGPESYRRDDDNAVQVAEHYRMSLERMIATGTSAGADILFVAPAANLKDCSPFKSEHTAGISEAQRARSRELLSRARGHIEHLEWPEALAALDEALAFDARFAELHYRRGEALFGLERHDEAKIAFERALEEDVCKLRILPGMQRSLREVTENAGLPLVDFVDWIEKRLRSEAGHSIPGEETFLDHVHPTVEAHGLLALRLIEGMTQAGLLEPVATWGDDAIAAAAETVRGRLDERMRAEGLAYLAQVLAWAGKGDEAMPLALRALRSGEDFPLVVQTAAVVLATQYVRKDDVDQAWHYFRKALHADPMAADLHFRIGNWIADTGNREFEVGFAHILHASVFWSGPGRDRTHLHLGAAMASRGRPVDALAHFLEAQRLNPRNDEAARAILQIRREIGSPPEQPVLQMVSVDKYPSGAASRIVQVKPNSAGRYVADGFWTEWYEGGGVKRFVEYRNGAPYTEEMWWDPNGNRIEKPEPSSSS